MSINPKRVKEIFLEAADLSDEAIRAAYLDKACGGDAELRARVEALLNSHDPEGSFLGTPAAVVPEPDHAADRTCAAEAVASDDEPLTFLSPTTRPDSLGRIGHYEVLQVLGKGGFGIVFRAFDDVLQRVVAVKVMAPHLAATSPARKRFLREAQSSAQVRHQNVVQVHDVGEQPLPYLVMEFIPGETLQQRLDRTGPLDVLEAVRIGRRIAEGLAAAHDHDLIHRDIKPGNILLESGPHGHAKITDFGLARAADDASLTQSGVIAGTPMYMAPEQAQGQTLDQRADLFSLGSVLYQMVAGRPPFRANTTVAVLKRVAEDQPRAIREIIPETPRWLCDIIAKLHAKKPGDRYQTAREVADVLADCEAQLKANARLKDFSRIPRSPSRPGGRRLWIAVVVAMVMTLLVLGLYVAQALRSPKSNHDDERWTAVAEGQDVEDWGLANDPDGDCRIQTMRDRVRITVPTKHDLSGWYKVYNAPRVTREVRGDFRARVRVRPFTDVGTNPGSPAQPYITGSLLLWGDEQHFARVDRVLQFDADLGGGRHLRHDVVAFHTGEQPLGPIPLGLRRIEPNGPSWLEIERRGDVVTARTSIDGVNWSSSLRLPPLDLPETVRVGVVAVCVNSSEPHRVEFEGFEVKPLAP